MPKAKAADAAAGVFLLHGFNQAEGRADVAMRVRQIVKEEIVELALVDAEKLLHSAARVIPDGHGILFSRVYLSFSVLRCQANGPSSSRLSPDRAPPPRHLELRQAPYSVHRLTRRYFSCCTAKGHSCFFPDGRSEAGRPKL